MGCNYYQHLMGHHQSRNGKNRMGEKSKLVVWKIQRYKFFTNGRLRKFLQYIGLSINYI